MTPSPPARRVLLLTHRAPYPPDRGDRIRSFNLLRALSCRHEVSLACVSDETVTPAHQRVLEKFTAQLAIAHVNRSSCRWRAARALLAGRSGTPAAFYDPRLAGAIAQWHHDKPFDAVIVFCTGMWHYLEALGGPNRRPAVQVLDMVDVDSLKWYAYARNARGIMRWVYRSEAGRLRQLEASAAHSVQAITLISDAEVKAYRQHVLGPRMARAQIAAVNNGVDLEYFHALEDADTRAIGFVGVLDYPPNVQGITAFVREVLPHLRRQITDAKLLIVGRHATREVVKLGEEAGVEFVGAVDDVRQAMARCSVMIAPLPIARGVQNKVLEAMASQRAVVCSPQAFEGINAAPQRDLAVAKNASEWTQSLATLLSDRFARERMARAARRQVEQHYHWDQALAPMLKLLEGPVAPAPVRHRVSLRAVG